MAYEQRDNSGTLFKNDRRDKESQPHAKGKAMIGGRMYWISAWTKDGAKGKFQSLSFELMEEQGGGDRQPARQGAGANFTHPPRKPNPPPQEPFPAGQEFDPSEIPF